MVLPHRSVRHDRVGNIAVGHLVLAHLHRHGRDRRHRRDAINIHLRKLLNKGKDGVELAPQMFHFGLGNRNTCEMRYAADGIGINGHASNSSLDGAG